MKTTFSLARNVRALLGVARVVTFAGLVITPLALAPVPFLETTGFVRFETDATHLPITADKSVLQTYLHVNSLSAKVQIMPNTPMSPDLLTLRRVTTVPAAMASLAMWFLVSHLLWRLFCRLEKGETFTDENLRLVRKIGVAIVACSLVEALAGIWSDWRVSQFLGQHFHLGNLTFQHAVSARFEPRFMFAGLIVLVVAEVFRQGLALKREAELTV